MIEPILLLISTVLASCAGYWLCFCDMKKKAKIVEEGMTTSLVNALTTLDYWNRAYDKAESLLMQCADQKDILSQSNMQKDEHIKSLKIKLQRSQDVVENLNTLLEIARKDDA